ncbi:hypothetical protein PV10_02922 [Exophiala mesophila]|uniref:Zinc finger Mcm10/DnaG-type domain-containing protein n=1 Tax=Exophiala mesophila TaxID=212818 RepID=A0A0D1ZKS4_EXOME|nr:uncharacterized protein PV10_02922 [Exophiala mesophila]KIV95247.1 hypothetical protein PV10_02922 [Exophiala mesophila]
MSNEVAWPPCSPRAALLSSPSGRKKYEILQTSPNKRKTNTPGLLDRLRAARNVDTSTTLDDVEDVEEDEEILQLKLEAIEARLKLKKLQQSKKTATPSRTSSRQPSSPDPETQRHTGVEVAVSPVRRALQPSLPKSPSRVILGIDKGLRAADVSLRRANTTAGTTRRAQDSSITNYERPSSQSSTIHRPRSDVSSQTANTGRPKSTFSERMSLARAKENMTSSRRQEIAQNRQKSFKVDRTEIETYQLAAEEQKSRNGQRSPTKAHRTVEYSREDILQAAQRGRTGANLKKARSTPNIREAQSYDDQDEDMIKGDATLFEGFSQLHLASRILPNSFLKRTLPTDKYSIYKIPDLLRDVKFPSFELPESVCDFVVFGIIASKSGAMDQKTRGPDHTTAPSNDWERKWDDGSQNQQRFMALTLTDLKWTIDLYLFGTALPRYHRLSPGTVVAILNPGIRPPRSGRSDTGAFTLSLNAGEDTVLEIGTARDLGHCKTLKKDGKECGSWVDASKTEICEWHLNAELQKTTSRRMGINTGTNGFGGGSGNGGRNYLDSAFRGGGGQKPGLKPIKEGQRYDRDTQSHFFISRSHHPDGGAAAAAAIRVENNPFGNTGQLDRDKDSRIRKQMAAKAKEREIAKQLGSLNNTHGFGGAGAEYLRQKAKTAMDNDDNSDVMNNNSKGKARQSHSRVRPAPASQILSPTDSAGSHRSALASRANILSGGLGTNANGKRTAQDVRLSPVKKTRFITDKGIREAGRESLGSVPVKDGVHHHVDDSDDDELEIV